MTLAKGIAGGMPLSAVTGRADLLDAVGPGGLGGTYGGNPVACAAALASIETMEEWNLNERATAIEKAIRGAIEPLVTESDIVGEVRGRGAMMAIEFVADSDPERGVAILPCGTYGNIVRLLPPLTISDELLDEALNILVEGIRSV